MATSGRFQNLLGVKISPMHIGFDAKRLFQNNTGLGNYSRSLVGNLKDFYPENNYTLFAPKIVVNERTKPFLSPTFQIITPKKYQPRSYWRSAGCVRDIREKNIDIFHGLSHELPFEIKKTDAKSIVTVHDLIFKRYPKQYSVWDRYIHDVKCRYACQNADKIIAISESTKRDIIDFYKIAPQKIEVVYQSCNLIFENNLKENIDGVSLSNSILEKINTAEKIILYVGSIIERKNLFNLVKAIELLPKTHQNAVLYIVGGGKNTYRAMIENYIAERNLVKKIVFLQNVSDFDLAILYKKANVFVYPSLYEGFGIPVIEALFSGTPVITSTQLALTEAAGESSCCIDVSKPEIIAESIANILNDNELAIKMRTAGLLHAQRFLPQKLSTDLMNVYKTMV